MTTKSENPRDKVKVPQSNLTFEQMLEQAIQDEGNDSKSHMGKSKSQASQFLKKKDRYDPKKSILSGQGNISSKNINKKRLFSKSKGGVD